MIPASEKSVLPFTNAASYIAPLEDQKNSGSGAITLARVDKEGNI